jgi:TnpA family transposase
MPVEFVTAEQEQQYGRYTGEPSETELAQYFYLDAEDWDLLGERRGDHNRLGFVVQLCTVRYLGAFVSDLGEVPPGVVTYLARQLRISDPTALARYQQGERRQEHALEIRAARKLRDWSDGRATFPLVRLLYARAWLSNERPSVLFEQAVSWLKKNKVLLPGITVLARWIAHLREYVAERLWHELASTLTPAHQTRLETLLVLSGESRQTPLDRLRRAPTRASAPALLAALARLEEIRALGVSALDLARIPPTRLKALAAYALTANAQTISRLTPDRRAATLLAFSRTLEVTAHDDALDVLDLLIHELLTTVERVGQQHRLRTLGDLDGAALMLADATTALLNPRLTAARLRTHLDQHRAAMQAAIATIHRIARPADAHYEEELLARYLTVRRFLPTLLRTLTFECTPAGRPVLEALTFLKELEGQKQPSMQGAPLACVPTRWRRYVTPKGGGIDRKAYTLCVLEQLHERLRHRELFVPGSGRWADPRAKLLSGSAWEVAKPSVCQVLGRSPTPEPDLTTWARELDAAYRRTVANLPTNTAVRFDTERDAKTGKTEERLVLERLEEIEEPASLRRLRGHVSGQLPQVQASEILLEIAARTRFPEEFRHVSEGQARVDAFPISLCAVLLAEACNLPLTVLVQPGVPALTHDRLLWVQQNYVRPDTINAANARLVTFHERIKLAQAWGGGEVASADGLRFVVPVRTLNAGPNRKYFGQGRGLTLMNYTLDHFFGFNGVVVPGTLRDSLFILEGLLQQDPRFHPTEIMTDQASYSDIVFGLFALLGYRFSPRLTDIGEARFWRADPAADYGPLNQISRHRLNLDLIRHHWEDLLRVAGSLKLGTIPASEVIRMLQRGDHPTTLGRAVGEVGRIAKTGHLLACIDDPAYRRRMLVQLNRGEARHGLARDTFFWHKGEVRQKYREGQEEQLGALGFVVNVIILWNTLYMDLALDTLRVQGREVKAEDVERLSPLGHDHISFVGAYSFALPEAIQQGGFHPLRLITEGEIEERE